MGDAQDFLNAYQKAIVGKFDMSLYPEEIASKFTIDSFLYADPEKEVYLLEDKESGNKELLVVLLNAGVERFEIKFDQKGVKVVV